jgi:type IV pilus assembly protein PilP
MTRRLLACVGIALLGLPGCKGEKRPPPRASVVSAPVAVPAAPEAAAEPAQPEWSYSSVGKRDPFRSFLSELQASGPALATRCNTALGRFELDQLKLVAVITGLADPVAMVEAPNGVGYAVRRGVCVGKNGGVVASVRSGEVVISEWAIRADGTRDRTRTVLKLPKEASLNLEEQP